MSQSGILNAAETEPQIPTQFVTNSGTAIPTANTLEILGLNGVSTSALGNIVYISVASSGFTWNVVTSSSPTNPIQIVAENGYICNGSALVTFLLPLAANIGDTFTILSNTARFQIMENGSQQMRVGAVISTAGNGTATSNTVGDKVEFTYIGGNIFFASAPQGTLTIV
jgi:hypothetical protein